MPMYVYGCGRCGEKHEMLRKIEERNMPHPCPSCGHTCDELEISTGVAMGHRSAEPEDWPRTAADDSEPGGGHIYVGPGCFAETRNNLFVGGRRGIVGRGKTRIKSVGDVFEDVEKPFVHLPY